jgi:hypothetical protein
MKYILGENVNIGDKILAVNHNRWKKIVWKTSTIVVLSDGNQIKYGHCIKGWKDKSQK